MYVFGSSELFKRIPLPSMLETLSLSLRMSLVLFYGRFGLPIPFRRELMYAVGEPVRCSAADRSRLVRGAPAAATNSFNGPFWVGPHWTPSEADFEIYHAAFCEALELLFEKHKASYGWAHKKLRLV